MMKEYPRPWKQHEDNEGLRNCRTNEGLVVNIQHVAQSREMG